MPPSGQGADQLQDQQAGFDCTNGHFSGVAQSAPSPKGGYIAPALASFAVNQTTHAKCALKTVAPGKAKVHTLKGHLFQCVGRTDVGGPEDLTPETPSDPQKPGTAIVDPVKPEKPSTAVADPVKPTISCANGVVKNGVCECEPHFKPVKAGKNLALRAFGGRSEAGDAGRLRAEDQLRHGHGEERRLQLRPHAQAGEEGQERLGLREGRGRSAPQQA